MKPFYLDGRWVETKTSEAVHNPWSGDKLAEVCTGSAEDVERAVASSHSAFQKTQKIPAFERAEKLNAICNLVAKRRQEFIKGGRLGRPLHCHPAPLCRSPRGVKMTVSLLNLRA